MGGSDAHFGGIAHVVRHEGPQDLPLFLGGKFAKIERGMSAERLLRGRVHVESAAADESAKLSGYARVGLQRVFVPIFGIERKARAHLRAGGGIDAEHAAIGPLEIQRLRAKKFQHSGI